MSFMEIIKEKAKKNIKHIVLPEGTDERMLRATEIIHNQKIAKITLLGDKKAIKAKAKKFGIDIKEATILHPVEQENLQEWANEYYEMRKHKGMTPEVALNTMKNELFYGAMMVRKGIADGGVAGAINSTGDVMRATFHLIGKAEGASIASSCFAMIIPEFMGQKDYVLFFADCAVIPNPDSFQLADIAIATAETRKALIGDEPLVAMLSFSTKGSAKHEIVDKVIQATKLVKERRPDIKIDGELQLDAAIIPEIGKKKAPESEIAGKANVLIFPDLNAGNIGYKLVERIANANAVGPFTQGLAKPFNDLSRGCSTEDIVNVVAVTAVKAQML